MPQKSLIQLPEYLPILKFIVEKKQFSSSEFIQHFTKDSKIVNQTYSKFDKTPYYKEVQNWSKKLQLLKNSGLIISTEIKINKIKGSNGGRSGIYLDNSFNYFQQRYFPNISKKHKIALLFLFNRELLSLLQGKVELKYSNIEDLFNKISFHISDYLVHFGLESQYKII